MNETELSITVRDTWFHCVNCAGSSADPVSRPRRPERDAASAAKLWTPECCVIPFTKKQLSLKGK